MTPHQAIALGAALGLVLVAVVAYVRWSRRRSALRQRNTRLERARHVPPPLPANVKVLPVPPVPTSADPWGDDEPTVFREPRGKV